MKSYIFTTAFGTALLFLTGLAAAPLASAQLTNIELLGKYVFFDKISSPKRMACVTCHDPETGGTGSVAGINLHQVAITGANPHTVGNLKPPTNAYASFIDAFKFDPLNCGFPSLHCGGNFWNGRAEGNEFPPLFPAGATKHIGDEVFYTTNGTYIPSVPGLPNVQLYDDYFGPTADQALNPMPNLVEQNIDRQAVCQHVESAKYAKLYKLVWGVPIDCSDTQVKVKAPDVAVEKAFDISFKRLMLAVCAWQHSTDLNSFSSKRDIALRNEKKIEDPPTFPLNGFTAQENLGHDLFYGKAGCTVCHLSDRVHPDGTGEFERYADDTYHNIGTPPNPEIPETFNEAGEFIDPDLGLAGHTGTFTQGLLQGNLPRGFHKTPTLCNVDKRPGKGFIKAYTHNGWFKSPESIVHFYNTAFLGVPSHFHLSISLTKPRRLTHSVSSDARKVSRRKRMHWQTSVGPRRRIAAPASPYPSS